MSSISILRLLSAGLIGGMSVPVSGQSAIDAFDPNANDEVRAVALQDDGKCLIGGDFTSVDGQNRSRLARLHADGSLDSGFDSRGANDRVTALAVQSDERILVAGWFSSLAGSSRAGLARLRPDGLIDDTFSSAVTGTVESIVVQPDGGILIGGSITALAGQERSGIGRLNRFGELDEGFAPNLDGPVKQIALQRDGKILVAGDFTTLGGIGAPGIGRLHPDGRVDAGFVTEPGGPVSCLVLQPDGKIVVGGAFTAWNSQPRRGIARLGPGGQLDPAFVPSVDGEVDCLAMQTDGEIVLGGLFSRVAGEVRSNLARLDRNGRLDPFRTGTNGRVLGLAIQDDGKIVAAGAFTALGPYGRNRVGRLHPDGSLDATFNPGSNAFPNGNGNLNTIAQQPDGRICVGGYQRNLADQSRNGLGRLFADGTLDPSFNPNGGEPPEIDCAVVEEDGKIVIGGQFSSIAGQPRNRLARLNPDGTLDRGFTTGLDFGVVWALARQADGKILVGGRFNHLGGVARLNIGRLLPDGRVDPDFNPGAQYQVYCFAVEPDGQILVGGEFTEIGGLERRFIARLHSDGRVDRRFDPGADRDVYSILAQPDGKIVVGGYFRNLAGQPRERIGRLNEDGSIDPSFNPGLDGDAPRVFSMALQTDRKIVVGGTFRSLGGQPRNQVGRLLRNGAVDPDFDPNAGASGVLYSVAVMDDAKIIGGGNYSSIGGQSRRNIARFGSKTAALQKLELDPSGTTLHWMRSGGGPEVEQVTFEISADDGRSFAMLGVATRIGGGWELSEIAPPVKTNFLVRARGRATCGRYNGCSSLVEMVQGFYLDPEISLKLSAGESTSLALAKVLRYATNLDPDLVEFDGPELISSNGGMVSVGEDVLTYTPPDGFTGTDFIVVLLDDGMQTATVSIGFEVGVPVDSASRNPPQFSPQSDGSLKINFHGIPGFSYGLERSVNLLDWDHIAVAIADSRGRIQFQDAEPTSPSAFYRLVYPPR